MVYRYECQTSGYISNTVNVKNFIGPLLGHADRSDPNVKLPVCACEGSNYYFLSFRLILLFWAFSVLGWNAHSGTVTNRNFTTNYYIRFEPSVERIAFLKPCQAQTMSRRRMKRAIHQM